VSSERGGFESKVWEVMWERRGRDKQASGKTTQRSSFEIKNKTHTEGVSIGPKKSEVSGGEEILEKGKSLSWTEFRAEQA